MGIRRATPADLDRILAIERECFPAPWSREALEGHLESGIFLVYEKGREIVGYLVAVPSWNPITGRFLHLLNLAVTGPERRKGIASALLGECIRMARGMGIGRVLLEVRKHNAAALSLYRKFGFRERAELGRFYADGDDAYLMELLLPLGEGSSPRGKARPRFRRGR